MHYLAHVPILFRARKNQQPRSLGAACLWPQLMLSAAIASALLATPVAARDLDGGASHTVQSGDIAEAWNVRGGSSLTLSHDSHALFVSAWNSTVSMAPGAFAGRLIELHAGSTLTATGGGVDLLRLNGSSAVLEGFTVDSPNSFVAMIMTASGGPATLTMKNSSAYARDNAAGDGTGLMWTGTGRADLIESSVVGQTNGVWIMATSATSSQQLLLDDSRVEGETGAAIIVDGYARRAEVDIELRNGSQLIGGNGILLDVLGVTASKANLTVGGSTIEGDVRVGAGHEANVVLHDGASLAGRFQNVTTAAISGGARWMLAGDSDVGELTLGAGGVVELGTGNVFNTLTVTGDYTGSGGTLLFNTVLGDDTAASDKLIVNGSTSGQTNVAINNVGGIGAQTVNGIQLIQVDGASNGEFNLAGRAVGGQYEYFLFKGGKADPNDGDWYLRTELPAVPDPCEADPTLPGCRPVVPPDPDPCLADPNAPGCVITLPEQCLIDPSLPQCLPPVPVLRPEPGAYLANQSAATQMFGTRFHDRNGGTARGLAERGAWARVSRNQADYGVIGDQLSVNGDTDVLQVGADVFSWGAERGQFGVMLGSGRANNTVTSRLTGYSAKGKVEGQAIGVYGSWLQDPAQTTGLYVDAWAQHAQFKNSVQGDGLSKERYDSTANSASVEAGYGIQVADGERVAMFVEPQLQLSYTRFSADDHTESNGTVINGSDANGLTSRVGVRFFGHANTEVGNRVQPFMSVNWIHESNDNNLRFDGERLSGGVPQDRYEAKAGASLQLGGRWTAWGDLGLQRGDGGYKDVGGQIGLRSSW